MYLKYLKGWRSKSCHPVQAQKSDISEQTITVGLHLPDTVISGVAKVIKVDKILGVEQEIRVQGTLYGVTYERIMEGPFTMQKGSEIVSINNSRAIQLPSAVLPPGFPNELQLGLLLDDNKGRKLTGYNPIYLTVVYGSDGIIKKLEVPGNPLIFDAELLQEWPVCSIYDDKVRYVLPITSGTYIELIQKISEMETLDKIGDSFW